MLALLVLAAAHVCPTPSAAYQIHGTLSAAHDRRLESYGSCVCGYSSHTDIDYEIYRDPTERRDRFHPSCARNWGSR